MRDGAVVVPVDVLQGVPGVHVGDSVAAAVAAVLTRDDEAQQRALVLLGARVELASPNSDALSDANSGGLSARDGAMPVERGAVLEGEALAAPLPVRVAGAVGNVDSVDPDDSFAEPAPLCVVDGCAPVIGVTVEMGTSDVLAVALPLPLGDAVEGPLGMGDGASVRVGFAVPLTEHVLLGDACTSSCRTARVETNMCRQGRDALRVAGSSTTTRMMHKEHP
jgi:hypothetical protein